MFTLSLLVVTNLVSTLGHPDGIMTTAIKQAISGSFNGSATILKTTIQTQTEVNELYFLDVLSPVLKEGWDFRIELDVNNEKAQSAGDHNLVLVDSYDAFRRLLPSIHAHKGDSQVFYLIVLKLLTRERSTDLMGNIFADMLRMMITNVNVLMEKTPSEVLFYTYFPYQETACRSTIPTLIVKFNNQTSALRQDFPPKVDHIHGCPMRVAARASPSFLTIIRKRRRETVLQGLEGEILKELATRMDFKITFSTNTFWDWGTVLPNGTAMGFFKKLEEGQVDMLIGAYVRDQYQDFWFTPSSVYFYTWLVIALQQPPYKLPKLSWLLGTFDRTTWTCIVVFLIASVICVTFAARNAHLVKFFVLQSQRSRILHILAMVVGIPVNYLPTMNFLRLNFVIWSLGVFMIRTAYQGKLFDSYRRVIVTKTPLSVRELLDDDYTIHSFAPIVDRLLLSGIEQFHFKTLVQYNVLNDLTQKNAVIGSEAHIVPYFKPRELETMVTEPLQSQQLCMYFQKHSGFSRRVNALITRMTETGIMQHWREQYALLKPIRFAPQKTYSPGPINLERFKYILLCLGAMYVPAGMTFLGELLWARFHKS